LVGDFNGVFFEPRKWSDSRRFLSSALDAGFVAIDTAPLYGYGAAEELLGRVLPSGIAVFTKVGVNIAGAVPTIDYSLKGMQQSIIDSLRRLKREQVDTLFIHNPPPAILRRDSIYEFLEWAVSVGVTKECGVSLAVNGDLLKIRDSHVVGTICITPPESSKPLRLPGSASLTLRSVLAGGELARDAGADGIQKRLAELIEHYGPANVIVGPRVPRHLTAYKPLLRR
jgi:hypothetical protein